MSMSQAAPHVSMSQNTFNNLIDGMTVQTFSMEQVSAMIGGAEPSCCENHDMYAGTFKGVKVRARAWRGGGAWPPNP